LGSTITYLTFFKSGNLHLCISVPNEMNPDDLRLGLINEENGINIPIKYRSRIGGENNMIDAVIPTRQVFFQSSKIEGNWFFRIYGSNDQAITLTSTTANKQSRRIGIDGRLFRFNLLSDGLEIREIRSKISAFPFKAKQIARWYRFRKNFLNTVQLDGVEGKTLVYIPWLERTADATIKIVATRSNMQITPFEIFKDAHNQKNRSQIIKFSRNNKKLVKDYLMDQFIKNRDKIKALIVTLDWTPPLRLAVEACRELGIPTILIPHESVFAREDMFYVEPITGVDTPICDLALVWGDLQKRILKSRGFENEIICVGAPKFDVYSEFQPSMDRSSFYSVANLDEHKKTILLALQPLDSQYDEKAARDAQLTLIKDLLKICIINDFQLIIRMPPALGNKVLNGKTIKQLRLFNEMIFIEGYKENVSPPMDAIYHTDITISINSTMLFEAALLNKPSISAKYTEFELFWEYVGIPIARNFDELNELILKYIGTNSSSVTEEGWEWAKVNLSDGDFNFDASIKIGDQIQAYLERISKKSV